ncbi:hypothetical protein DH86_00003166, partial [Scytalidium sp. 3C]
HRRNPDQVKMSPTQVNGVSTSGHPSYKIASIPADGIGPEVISAGITVLQKLASTLKTFDIDFTHFEWGSDYYKKHGQYLPEDALAQVKKFDAILFGAVGAPDVPDHISLWGLRLALCQPLQQGTQSPLRNCKIGDLDWVIIRENSEGEYAGHGGTSHTGNPWSVATEVSIFTRHGVERIMRFAFETARSRPRKKLTVVTKSNAQRNGMVFWDKVASEVAKDFPDVEVDKMLVDAITGKGVANPVATFWTASEMLRWLGQAEAADLLMTAVENVTESGIKTQDLEGSNTTVEVTDAVCKEIDNIARRKK